MNFKPGDIVWMDFNPVRGHEQAERRPALIVSNEDFTKYTGLYKVCSITNTLTGHPMSVPLDSRTITTGEIQCVHERTVDLCKRNPKQIEECPADILQEVVEIIHECYV